MTLKKEQYCDPFKVFAGLVNRGYPVKLFLDSCLVHPKTGRFSLIAVGEVERFSEKDSDDDPFKGLSKFFENVKRKYWNGDKTFFGIFGFVSYDALRYIEKVSLPSVDDLKMPDIFFFVPENLIVFDNISRVCFQVFLNKPINLLSDSEIFGDFSAEFLKTNMGKDEFVEKVRKIKRYIESGDTFQVNFSQRFDFSFKGNGAVLYQRLRSINPSPFSFYMKVEDFEIISCSPERLFRISDGTIETRPIAGTRPPKKRNELYLSEKERAEHIMLVDLERNDLGRICEYGSVVVDELMTVESYSHVVHLVSNIRGTLKKEVGISDVFKSMFPGGTITGAPKVRTMEIISELEPTRRGLYTGSVGFWSFSGYADFNIVIRTLIRRESFAFLQVGAGIVWDSEPEREFEETVQKGKALTEAMGVIIKV